MAYHIFQWEVIWPLCQIVTLKKIVFIKPHCPTIKAQKKLIYSYYAIIRWVL